MKFIFTLLLILIVATILQFYLPWWIIAIVAFAANLIWQQKAVAAFFTGFLGIGLTWISYAIWIDWHSNAVLSKKIATLLNLPSSWLLVLITLVMSGLVGGFSALTGNLFRKIIFPDSEEEDDY